MMRAEDLARGAIADIMARLRRERLAQLDQRSDGSLWCARHATAVDPDDEALVCPGCVADAARQRTAEERLERFGSLWPCDTLPRWPWARLGVTSWQQRVDPRAIAVVRLWAPSRSLFVLGPTGCGKTSAVVARLHELAAEARTWATEAREGPCPLRRTLYATEIQLHQARRRHPLGDGEAPLVDEAMRVPCLVLDEVGATGDLITHEVVDERNRRGLPTVALSGFDAPALIGRIGDACFRRLEQGAAFVDLYGGV